MFASPDPSSRLSVELGMTFFWEKDCFLVSLFDVVLEEGERNSDEASWAMMGVKVGFTCGL